MESNLNLKINICKYLKTVFAFFFTVHIEI